jgi:hypothetical protein
MGAWGPAIFSDDTASDVRGDYRDLVGDGLTGPEATDRMLKDWRSSVDDADDGPVFWLALAATQWKCGRLEERVKVKAIEIIDQGTNLERWKHDPKLLKQRQTVLVKLRAQLLSRQPPEKKIPKRYRNRCDWDIGELLSYRLLSEKLILLRVIGQHTDKGGTAPVFEILDWIGDAVPSNDVIRQLDVKKGKLGRQIMVGRLTEKEFPEDRVCRLGMKLPPTQDVGGFMVSLWRFFDRQLQELFGLS